MNWCWHSESGVHAGRLGPARLDPLDRRLDKERGQAGQYRNPTGLRFSTTKCASRLAKNFLRMHYPARVKAKRCDAAPRGASRRQCRSFSNPWLLREKRKSDEAAREGQSHSILAYERFAWSRKRTRSAVRWPQDRGNRDADGRFWPHATIADFAGESWKP